MNIECEGPFNSKYNLGEGNMHFFYVFKSCISNIYKRKFNFLMTTIVFFISFYMIMLVSNCYFSSIYTKLQLKSKLKKNKYISVKLYDVILSDENNKNYVNLIKFLNDEYKNDFGVYYFTNQYIYDKNKQQDLDVIAVNNTLLEINNVDLVLNNSKNKKYIYLPESMKSNVGDKIVISSNDNKYEYIVDGFINDDIKMIDNNWEGSGELFLNLSDAAIISFDWDDIPNFSKVFFFNFNIFIRYDNEEEASEIKNTVFKFANKYNIKLYVNTFDEMLDKDLKSNMAKINEAELTEGVNEYTSDIFSDKKGDFKCVIDYSDDAEGFEVIKLYTRTKKINKIIHR